MPDNNTPSRQALEIDVRLVPTCTVPRIYHTLTWTMCRTIPPPMWILHTVNREHSVAIYMTAS